MPLILGQTELMSGDVTTLQWIKPGHEADTEAALGYHSGKLAQGYWIVLLKQMPKPADFEFAGTTLRSGGREGLPAVDPVLDALRPRVHEQMKIKYGATDYVRLQQEALSRINLQGLHRIAKVLPDLRHNPAMAPSDQYPMGGGGLQWKIKGPPGLAFVIAVRVEPNGIATTATFSVDLRNGGYGARAKLRNYMTTA